MMKESSWQCSYHGDTFDHLKKHSCSDQMRHVSRGRSSLKAWHCRMHPRKVFPPGQAACQKTQRHPRTTHEHKTDPPN